MSVMSFKEFVDAIQEKEDLSDKAWKKDLSAVKSGKLTPIEVENLRNKWGERGSYF